MKTTAIRQLLEVNLSPAQCRLHHHVIEILEKKLVSYIRSKGKNLKHEESETQLIVIQFLTLWVQEQVASLDDLYQAYDEFVEQHTHAVTLNESQRHVLNFAEKLGAGARQLRADRTAFSRWFGVDAVSERFQRRSAERGRDIAFVLRRIGVLSAQLLSEVEQVEKLEGLWRRLALEDYIVVLLNYKKFESIRIAAFHCLVDPLHVLPSEVRSAGVSDGTLRYIYKSTLDRRQDVWLQCEALRLLATLSIDSFCKVAQSRLEEPGSGDDLFVRRQIVRLMGDKVLSLSEPHHFVQVVCTDPSPAVRQTLVSALAEAPEELLQICMNQLICEDEIEQVRGSSVLACLDFLGRSDCFELILSRLEKVLQGEKSDFVLRVGLLVTSRGYSYLCQSARPEASAWHSRLMPLVTNLHLKAESVAIRRYASRVRESIWVRGDQLAWRWVKQLRTFIASIPEGRARKLPADININSDEERFGRVLAWLAQEDFGFDIIPGTRPKIIRGHRFGFRAWRFLHEMRHPSTDKRQSFRHTTGRIFEGRLRVPSGILAELAQTKVPGEPLHISNDADWRPYLPLVDELISALDLNLNEKTLDLYTSEGVTEVVLPTSFRRRLAARIKLTYRFAYYAELRNWREEGSQAANNYLSELKKLGFDFRIRRYSVGETSPVPLDDKVTRFFPAVFPILDGDWWGRLRDYFFSVYENTLSELILFLIVAGSWFFGRHVYLYYLIMRARRAMPLVIGGWGTRGKSGTERLKAALFNALGYNVVSKTSGCEAMFLHGYAHGNLREMFLFRPYDKATIWEQANVLRLAGKLNGEVFLWECMGLTPSYIEILQQQWMRDDLSTITNTYPDHEDLQGPAGVNIPQVMTQFIPPESVLLTSEEQMLPILREAAVHQKTKVRSVGWLQAGLLAPDLLSRFPYEEHPYNIALVMDMADELGIEPDFSIREMADRVVADLGVLKVTPKARIRGRHLDFTNGMSANERFGCMANWERMGFGSQDPYTEPGVWLTTVVNNRADRVSRSKVFASMLVSDLMVDRHVLIGTNLDGLQSYIRDAWREYSASLTLWPSASHDNKESTPLAVLTNAAKRFRLLITREAIEAELTNLLENLGVSHDAVSVASFVDKPTSMIDLIGEQVLDVNALADHVRERVDTYTSYQQLVEAVTVDKGTQNEKLDDRFKALMKQWFESKFIVIENSHATGEEVITEIMNATPPGVYNRIMGVQNIKGTGLDFVYRWQAWELCHAACTELLSDDASVSQRGLQALVSFRDYGSLSEQYVTEVVETVKHSVHAQTERFQAELNMIQSNVEMAMRKVNDQQASQSSLGWLGALVNGLEAFIDAGDAITRRKRANLIYRDLANERISHAQAALELQALNKRQKGGWLISRLGKLLGKVTLRLKR